MRAVIADFDRLAETTHRFRNAEDRVGFGANVAEQINAAAVTRSMMGTCYGVDQIGLV